MTDRALRQFVEWRKTFAPTPKHVGIEKLQDPIFLDELYSRDLLGRVPEIVQRTLALTELVLPEAQKSESIVYLREAASCFIFGLPQAAVALARAAVESRLRDACAKVFGDKPAREAEFINVINDLCVRGRVLSAERRGLAHKVREAANRVLHDEPIDSTEALGVFEAARTVILSVSGRS